MIQCLPQGICSWNYVLRGEGHHAVLTFHWASEQGTVDVDGTRLDVVKHGFASGRWTLELHGEAIAEAHKPSSFSRAFDLATPDGPMRLEAEGVFSGAYRLKAEKLSLARMSRVHLLTRRARIERTPLSRERESPDFATMAFAFWLTALMWKRAAQRNNS